MSWLDCGVSLLDLMRFDHMYFTRLNGGPCESKNGSERGNWGILDSIICDYGRIGGILGLKYGMFCVVEGFLCSSYIILVKKFSST